MLLSWVTTIVFPIIPRRAFHYNFKYCVLNNSCRNPQRNPTLTLLYFLSLSLSFCRYPVSWATGQASPLVFNILVIMGSLEMRGLQVVVDNQRSSDVTSLGIFQRIRVIIHTHRPKYSVIVIVISKCLQRCCKCRAHAHSTSVYCVKYYIKIIPQLRFFLLTFMQ